MARVLIGCETSGIVRNAFLDAGHDCWSCDLLPSDTPSNRHIQDDVRNVIQYQRWDMLAVMHPPCTRLCNSGVRWLHKAPPGKTLDQMWRELDDGCALFTICGCDIPLIAVEISMHRHAKGRIRNYQPHGQSVQPWQFADADDARTMKKRTCFWLRGLPTLIPTGKLDSGPRRVPQGTASADRWKIKQVLSRAWLWPASGALLPKPVGLRPDCRNKGATTMQKIYKSGTNRGNRRVWIKGAARARQWTRHKFAHRAAQQFGLCRLPLLRSEPSRKRRVAGTTRGQSSTQRAF